MSAVLAGVALMLLAAGFAVTLRKSPRVADVAYQVLLVAGCVVGAAAAIGVLIGGEGRSFDLPSSVPGGRWVFSIDPLSAVFVLGICTIGIAGALFGASYLERERDHRAVWWVHAVFAAELMALMLVVTARAIMPFLMAWELMAIGSFLLIVVDHENDGVRRAGLLYLIATHTGTLVLVGMFALWGAQSSDWTFTALAAATSAFPGLGATVLALAVVGFGFKAGLVPLHFWLPSAHAAAPTHISALLSGIVIKMGIYGILRVVSLVAGTPPVWWGWMMLGVGTASAVLGVLWALAQHDIKRLLAYHSVENIGIIAMGIGVGALGSSFGHPVVATIGYGGALLHTINHSLFKSLLFFGAGVVQRATGSRNMETLGGLAKRLPYTWLTFFLAATAIIGVPPLNGFVSEWLVYQGLIRAAQAPEMLRLAALGAPALALTGGLALACFAKVSGIVFLGSPRSSHADAAREAGARMLAPMFALAAACILLGVYPALGIGPALRVAATIAHGGPIPGGEAAVIARDAGLIGLVALSVFVLLGVLALFRGSLLRRRTVRTADTWGCGYTAPTVRMQYTASSFAAPLISTFGRLSGVVEHRRATAFESHPLDLVLHRVALPVWTRVQRAALRLRPIQQGRLFVYLIYVLVALLALLAYLALVT